MTTWDGGARTWDWCELGVFQSVGDTSDRGTPEKESVEVTNTNFAYFVYPPTAATSLTASAGVAAENTVSEPSTDVGATPPEEQMTRYAG